MQKFKIEDRTQLVTIIEVYEIEAETSEEALGLYCDELAGSIDPISSNMEPYNPETDGDIKTLNQ